MKKKKKLPLDAVRALLIQGLYLEEVARVTGYRTQELSIMNQIWGLRRKRGPKVGWKKGLSA
jgi:hypothetical protein